MKLYIKALSAALTVIMAAGCVSCERVDTTRDISVTADTSTSEATEETSAEETVPASEASTDTSAETSVLPTETVTTTATAEKKSASELGSIYDVSGKLLRYSEGGRRVSPDEYAVSFANIITEMSAGYDTTFHDILAEQAPDGSAQSLRLTIDADMQNAVYSYLESMNVIGSAVVMRSDGSLAAQVSYPSYDPNAVADQKYDEDLAWGDCGNKAFQNYEPGSCFKIMSEVIADKHGVYSLYDDGEWKYDDTSIKNWDWDTNMSYPIAERTLASAFVNSSNIFFAKAFDQIGAEDVLSDLDSIFHFITDIDCDFGPIHNNVEIYCEDDLRRTAFGQSYVLTCPIYLAALGREAVFGDMVRPFVVEGGTSGEVIASIPEEYRQNLRDGMLGVASNLGLYIPEGYTLYAKTGTAETWLEEDFLYITGCVKSDTDDGTAVYTDHSGYNGSYVIVMQIQNPSAHGFEFASESARVYQGVVNAVFGG